MARPLSILLIEDEPLECQEIIEYIESTAGVQLVGVTNNIVKGLDFVAASPPDAIILDLELHKGHGSGLAFLKSLRAMKIPTPLYVLVTTNNTSYLTHEAVREMGADFIMVKSQGDYSAKSVIDFLHSIKSIIHRDRMVSDRSHFAEPPQLAAQKTMGRVIDALNQIGIPPHAVGRKYLIDGIILLINGQRDKLFQSIAVKYAKTASSVERAMQIAIEKAWKTAHIKDLEKYYTARIYSSRGVPTLLEFMHYYAEKIKNG